MDVTLEMVLGTDVALGVDSGEIMALKIYMRKHLGLEDRVGLRENGAL